MKIIMMILLAVFSLTTYADHLPTSTSTPLYECNHESFRAHIFRKASGQNAIFIETMSDHRAPTPWLEENVSELTNKTHTVYTSNDLILKITHDDSGFMPSTLIISSGGTATQSEMTCQWMYKVIDGAHLSW